MYCFLLVLPETAVQVEWAHCLDKASMTQAISLQNEPRHGRWMVGGFPLLFPVNELHSLFWATCMWRKTAIGATDSQKQSGTRRRSNRQREPFS